MRSEINSPEVRAKAAAALEWCRHATDYATRHQGKPWKYVLIPHDEVASNGTLPALVARYSQNGERK